MYNAIHKCYILCMYNAYIMYVQCYILCVYVHVLQCYILCVYNILYVYNAIYYVCTIYYMCTVLYIMCVQYIICVQCYILCVYNILCVYVHVQQCYILTVTYCYKDIHKQVRLHLLVRELSLLNEALHSFSKDQLLSMLINYMHF